ncbi:MAG TPA: hypothetical protein VGO89_21505 [Streptomyces sp.]|jgi:hypothetical protein|nr:hypothetical protein [Streptomyces sp.]
MTDSVEHDVWEARFESLLVQRGLDRETAESCAKEAVSHCHETQESPEQAFGDVEEYADRTAVARIPVSRRMKTGSFTDYTVREFWHDILEFPGNYLAIAGIVLWIKEGLWTDVTVRALTAVTLLGVVLAIAAGAQTLWTTAGRPRTAVVALAAALGTAALVPLSMQHLPRTELARIPPVALIAVGLVLIFLAERVPRPGAGAQKGIVGVLRGPKGGSAAAAVSKSDRADRDEGSGRRDRSGRRDPEAETRRWLRRLDGLLQGRHLVARSDRRRLVAEARAHLAETGARPQEEFGDVERYALTLVEEGAARRPTRRAVRWTLAAAYFAFSVVILLDTDWENPGWFDWLRVAVTAGVGWWLVKHYRDKWPVRTAGSAKDE